MEFNVTIKCDNDAFHGFHGGPDEIVRMLRGIANRISAKGELTGNILDYNGNSVGSYEFGLDKGGK